MVESVAKSFHFKQQVFVLDVINTAVFWDLPSVNDL